MMSLILGLRLLIRLLRGYTDTYKCDVNEYIDTMKTSLIWHLDNTQYLWLAIYGYPYALTIMKLLW